MKKETTKRSFSLFRSRRGLAVLLAATLLVTMSAVYSAADEFANTQNAASNAASIEEAEKQSQEETPKAITVTMNDLQNEIANQSVDYGTSNEKLILPKTLVGRDNKNETVEISGIKWSSTPTYDGESPGVYSFKATLPEGYTLDSNKVPTIKVTVNEKNEDGNTEDGNTEEPTGDSSNNGGAQTPAIVPTDEAIKSMDEPTKALRATEEVPFVTSDTASGYIITNVVVQVNNEDFDPAPGGTSIIPTPMAIGDTLKVFFAWELTEAWDDAHDHNGSNGPPIQDGDYMFVTINKDFPILVDHSMSKPIFDTREGVQVEIGTLTWAPVGTVMQNGHTVTADDKILMVVFNDALEDLGGISGTVAAESNFYSEAEEGSSISIEPIAGEGSFNFTIKETPPGVANVSKANEGAQFTAAGALSKIDWRISVNSDGTKLNGPLIISDDVTAGGLTYAEHSIDQTSVKVAIYGTGGRTLIPTTAYSITFPSTGFAITIHEDYIKAHPTQGYSIYYSSIPTTPADEKNYYNRATVGARTSSATYVHPTNSKSGVYKTDMNGGPDYIEWTVLINRNGSAMPDLYNVIETLPTGVGDPKNIDLRLINSSGATTTGNLWTGAANNYVKDTISTTSTNFRFGLVGPAISPNTGYNRYQLKFTTPVTSTLTDTTIVNSISVDNKTITGGATNPYPPGEPRPGPGMWKGYEDDSLTTPVLNSAGDAMIGTIDWVSVLFPNQTKLAEIVIIDEFGPHTPTNMSLELSPASLHLYYGAPGEAGTITLSNMTGQSFGGPNQPNEYMIDKSTTTGFAITLNPSFNVGSGTASGGKSLYLTYTTDYTIPVNDAGQLADMTHTFVNTTWSKYKDITDPSDTFEGETDKETDYATYYDKKTMDNGEKEGLLTDGVIKWDVTINENGYDFGSELVITDTLPVPVTTTASNYKGAVRYITTPEALAVKNLSTGAILTHGTDYTIDVVNANDGVSDTYTETIEITIKNPGKQAFEIVYYTELYGQPLGLGPDGKPIPGGEEYVNTVSLPTGRDILGTVISTPPSIIEKGGALTDGILDTGRVDWTISINKSNTRIMNAVLTDEIGLGHSLIENDPKYPFTVEREENGTFVPLVENFDYTVSLINNDASRDDTVLTITFTDPIETEHVIKYTTLLNKDYLLPSSLDPDQQAVGNTVKLEGDGLLVEPGETEVMKNWSDIFGTGGGSKAKTTIVKTAENDPTLLLEGAVFKVESSDDPPKDPNDKKSGYVYKDDLTTNDKGEIIILLPKGDYTITELIPPMGYTYGKVVSQKLTIDDSNLVAGGTNLPVLTFSNPEGTVACEVDKDTIKRTSFAYDNVQQEGIQNTGSEQYRYDVDFRSTSDAEASFFWVDDPLENVAAGHVVIDAIWTPIVWGDKDGTFNVLYKSSKSGGATTPPGAPYSNAGYSYWPGGQNLDTSQRYNLTVPSGEKITAIRLEYGAVQIGFTSKNYDDISQNGEHRKDNGSVNLPLGTGNSVFTSLQGKNIALLEAYSDETISSLATGIGGNVVDWTPENLPDPRPPYYDELLALPDEALQPISYLVHAPQPMSSVNIISSAESNIAVQVRSVWLSDDDQDAVLTRVIVPFNADPEEIDVESIVSEDSFVDHARAQGVTLRGGKLYGPDGKLLSNEIATGDKALIGLWLLLMAGALVCATLLLRVNMVNRRKIAESKGGARK